MKWYGEIYVQCCTIWGPQPPHVVQQPTAPFVSSQPCSSRAWLSRPSMINYNVIITILNMNNITLPKKKGYGQDRSDRSGSYGPVASSESVQ